MKINSTVYNILFVIVVGLNIIFLLLALDGYRLIFLITIFLSFVMIVLNLLIFRRRKDFFDKPLLFKTKTKTIKVFNIEKLFISALFLMLMINSLSKEELVLERSISFFALVLLCLSLFRVLISRN